MSDDTEAERILARHAGSAAVSPLDANPVLKRFMECWLDTFLVHGSIDPRLRQLTILRVAWRCNQPFEWANHYRRARSCGVADDEIRALCRFDYEGRLGREATIVLRAADQVVDLGLITPETYAACSSVFPDPGVRHEFLHLVAGYRMMATTLNTTRPSVVDAGLPWWPPDGVAPDGSHEEGEAQPT